ncbi:MAG: substrate-binding domain-containing protein [Actinobacteria bacterium]|nr:substrate-binding domain-containing protein [Actinomycetota bacterium]
MNVTIEDIAKTAGLSGAAISMALRNHPEINPGTCRRVQQIAKIMGYRRNTSARALVTRKHHTVTLVMGSRRYEPMAFLGAYGEIVRAAADRLAQEGYKLLISAEPAGPQEDDRWMPGILQEHSYDGLLVFMPPDPELQRELQSFSGCPYVVIDSPPMEGTSTVVMDEEQQARVLTEYLIKLGHRKIGYVNAIGPSPGHSVQPRLPRIRLREVGYLRAMTDAGLRPSQGNEQTLPVKERLPQLFGGDNSPTALIFYGSGAAYEGIEWLAERGLKVPDDVSVTSITDFPEYRVIGITCPRRRWEEIGSTAVEILLGQLTDPRSEPRSISLMTEVEVRRTTAPPPGTENK